MTIREDPFWKSIRFLDGRTIIKTDILYMSFDQRVALENLDLEAIGHHRYIVKETTT